MSLTYITIQNEAKVVRTTFPKLARLCVGGSAALSMRLTNAGIENYVALGSLYLREKALFKYSQMEWGDGSNWDGHAWCVVENTYIADVTVTESLRYLPDEIHNVKKFLHTIPAQQFLVIARAGVNTEYGELSYVQESILPEDRYNGVVGGLIDYNASVS